jgi:hypothetical protein
MVCKLCGHCWRAFLRFCGFRGFDFQSGVITAKVEMSDKQGNGMFQVGQLL